MDWSKMQDPRMPEEKYEPDIAKLVTYAAEYWRHVKGNGKRVNHLGRRCRWISQVSCE